MAIRRSAAAILVAALALAAAGPRALAPARGGLWQVSNDARGSSPQEVCIAEPVALSQWAHRGERCARTILSDRGDKAVIDYSCGQRGFGRSELTLVTPRTLRVATQGIAGGAPFHHVLHARRVGNCRAR